ncbi:hypothetical protein RRF57_012526 [Xylaria bambusicola]|uniref:Uncharacterized protein n=1 Tax=Xylaria bambusicola TaxID=326684 RepID=A0AAN7V5Q8_9PEZI
MSDSSFSCTCSAAFANDNDLEAHLREWRSATFQDRQLVLSLRQRLEQTLSHSRAEDDAILGCQGMAPSDDDGEATTDAAKRTSNPLAKHKNREGYHCPYEECKIKPVRKLAGLRDHYGTRKILPS